MNDIPTRTVSLSSSSFSWDIVDNRAYELGLDRSKYTQMLYELDLKYNLLSNHRLLDVIKNPRKYRIRILDIVVLLFLLAILTVLIASWVLL